MSGPNGIKVNALDVKDNEDGTYRSRSSSAIGTLDHSSRRQRARGQGEHHRSRGDDGPLHAACVLKGGPGMKRTEVWRSTTFTASARYDANGRGMSGQEAITMHMITPAGDDTLPACLPKRLATRRRCAGGSWSP